MPLQRLNQTIKRYSKTTDEFGDTAVTYIDSFLGRLVQGQSTYYQGSGNEAQYDASLHLNAAPTLQEGDIVSFEDVYYTVQKVVATRGLDGNIQFQWCELVIEKGI